LSIILNAIQPILIYLIEDISTLQKNVKLLA